MASAGGCGVLVGGVEALWCCGALCRLVSNCIVAVYVGIVIVFLF